jgi:hypothetical protein
MIAGTADAWAAKFVMWGLRPWSRVLDLAWQNQVPYLARPP